MGDTAPSGEYEPLCSKCGIHLEPDDEPCWLYDCPLLMTDSTRTDDTNGRRWPRWLCALFGHGHVRSDLLGWAYECRRCGAGIGADSGSRGGSDGK